MRSLKLSLLSLSLVAGLSTSAAAQTLTFDEPAINLGWMPAGYGGFTWSNAFIMNPGAVYGIPAAGGFGTALSSGTRVLGNGGGNVMSISGTNFNLLSGVFAAAWTNGLNLNVQGFFGGNKLYDSNYTLNWGTASNLQLNLFGVDNVVFTSTGGTVDQAFPWDSNQSFAADNLTFGEAPAKMIIIEDPNVGINVVPEPMTVSLMAAGLLALGGVQIRRRRAVSR
ncbi:MAG: PEP-CTERM sorting domain-containing protein [Gemmatimonas sp.]